MTNLAEAEVLTKPQKVEPDTETEQDPINYEVIIKDIEKRTGITCRGREIQIVVEAIANVADKPNRELVIKVLYQIAEQSGFNMVGNHQDAILAGQAKRAWEQVNEAQPAEEPKSETQTEEEPMRAGNAAGGPVVGFRPIGTAMDPSGGPSRNLGEPMDEIVYKP